MENYLKTQALLRKQIKSEMQKIFDEAECNLHPYILSDSFLGNQDELEIYSYSYLLKIAEEITNV